MKNKRIGVLIIVLVLVLSVSAAVQAVNIGEKISIFGILGDVNGNKEIDYRRYHEDI